MRQRIADRKALFFSIFFTGFISCIYAPFELYALNTQDLWFTLTNFWYIPLACGAFAMIAAAVPGLFLGGTLLKLYTGMILGFGICIYVQGNFLNLKLGQMTGSVIDWTQYRGRMILNLLLWIIIICVTTALCVWGGKKKPGIVSKTISGISLFITAMLLVTLTVLIVPCLQQENEKRPEEGYPTNKDLLSLSPSGNVVVLVLDTYDINYFRQALQEVPEFEEQLDGFIWFDNFTGCYPRTSFAIPFMLSGNYCKQGDPYKQVGIDSAERLYLDELSENGYDTSFYTQYNLVPDRARKNAVNYVNADCVISDRKAFTFSLYSLVICKYFPDICKPAAWLSPADFEARRRLDSDYRIYATNNLTLVDHLDQQEMTADADRPQFKFIHVDGAHLPSNIDEWGHRTEDSSQIEEIPVKGSLRLALRYLEEMKSLNVYDNSAIIITADHGVNTRDGDWYESFNSPVFLVKPAGAKGALTVNHTPCSQSDLGATILELAGIDTESSYGVSVFDETGAREKKRYYYKLDQTGSTISGEAINKLTEYEIDPEGNSPEHFHPTGVEYGSNDEETAKQ